MQSAVKFSQIAALFGVGATSVDNHRNLWNHHIVTNARLWSDIKVFDLCLNPSQGSNVQARMIDSVFGPQLSVIDIRALKRSSAQTSISLQYSPSELLDQVFGRQWLDIEGNTSTYSSFFIYFYKLLVPQWSNVSFPRVTNTAPEAINQSASLNSNLKLVILATSFDSAFFLDKNRPWIMPTSILRHKRLRIWLLSKLYISVRRVDILWYRHTRPTGLLLRLHVQV